MSKKNKDNLENRVVSPNENRKTIKEKERRELKEQLKEKRHKKTEKQKMKGAVKVSKETTQNQENNSQVELNPGKTKKSSSAWTWEQKKFLLKQLIHRDFKSRYKRAALGVLWSMLSPLVYFVAQAIVFSHIFNRGEHYITYLITGNIVYRYFIDTTTNSMFAIQVNGGIINNIKVNKDIFLFSRCVSCLLNFGLTLIIMFIIIAIDKTPFHLSFVLLVFPIICMFFWNMGLGYILSTLFVFFKDTQYLYGIVTSVLIYFSAIFYRITIFSSEVQKLFYLNPVYCYIEYFRTIIIDDKTPSLFIHLLCIGYALLFMLIGKLVYKLNDNKFAYYF